MSAEGETVLRDLLTDGTAATDLLPLGLRILHAAPYSRPDDAQLQLREHRAHLDERLTHLQARGGAGADDPQPAGLQQLPPAR